MGEALAPRHVAIIMDGNGRWATSKGLKRTDGHSAGVETVRRVVEAAADMGIEYLTLFGFSSENWNRPKEEVGYLMNLIRVYLKKEVSELNKNGVCLKIIGDRSSLDADIIQEIENCEELTKNNKRITVTIALSYGGRQDIINAAKKIATEVTNGNISLNDINENSFSNYLDTAGTPDPDLMIRTSGEQRISNFLMWQLSYAELYFTETHWPDFSAKDLSEAVEAFKNRDRRFGKIKDKARA